MLTQAASRLIGVVVGCGVLILVVSAEAIGQDWGVSFDWKQGRAAVSMFPASTHVCVLTRVTGEFQGSGEGIRLQIVDGVWKLFGKSKQSGVAATATCFAKSAFLANGGDRVISEELVVKDNRNGCLGRSADAGQGNAATYLSGISGSFRGGGERAVISQSLAPFTSSSLEAASCAGWLEARAYSFFAGAFNSGIPARFWGNEYSLTLHTDDPQSKELQMAPSGDAMCYLTRIEGQFDGGAEVVKIYPKTVGGLEYWFLYVRSGKKPESGGREQKWIKGAARCYKRDQL